MRQTVGRGLQLRLAVIALLLLPIGCAALRSSASDPVEDLRGAIRQTVALEQRRAELLRLTDEWAGVLDQLAEEVVEGRQGLHQLILDYSSQRGDFKKLFEDYVDRRKELKHRIIEIHIAMKEQTTDNEWRSLEKAAQTMTTSMIHQDLASAGRAI